MHGQFVWYELTTPDPVAAQKFYTPLTGWGTQAFDKDYTMFTTRGVPVAGIFKLGPEQRQQGIPPNWMPYVDVDNVDESARKVTSLGGKVFVGPQDVPNVGRFAVVQDPQGAVFGIYKSNRSSQGFDGTAIVGRFSWHELMTTDYRKAFDFYRQLFGWEQTGPEMDMGPGGKYFMYGKKGKMYGGMFNRPPEMASMSPFWMCYIHVKDVRKTVEAATRAGASVMQPPMDVPGGMIAVLGDPQGAGFALHHMSQQPAAAAPSSSRQKATAGTSAGKPATKASKTKAAPKKKAAAKKKAVAKKPSRRR
jgi:predicted enzyme related to lactoylglutathione lyase